MASSWTSGNLTAAIKANEIKQKEQADRIAQLEAEFKKEHGSLPKTYVADKVSAALSRSGADGGYEGRSAAGKKSAEEPALEKEMAGDVKAYHDMEEDAKAAARRGDHAKAAKYYDTAATMRLNYEKATGRLNAATGLPNDPGHAHRVVLLRARRDSLIGLPGTVAKTDSDVVAAKLVVTNFFQKHGIAYPI